MKKLTVIFLVAFIIVLAAVSCNQKTCPAYSKVNTEQVGQNV